MVLFSEMNDSHILSLLLVLFSRKNAFKSNFIWFYFFNLYLNEINKQSMSRPY